MKDEEIDTSDSPPLDDAFLERAELRLPGVPPTQQVTLQVDTEVLAWFQAQGDLLSPSEVLQHRPVNGFGGSQVLHRPYLLVLCTSSLVENVQLT